MDEPRIRLTDLSSLITNHYSTLAGITKILRIIPGVQPRPNIRSHSVLFLNKSYECTLDYEDDKMLIKCIVMYVWGK